MPDKHRILIIEDDKRLREVLKKILDREGFDVEISGDGAGGITEIKQDFFDIALTDLKMPGIDGMEVLRVIKRISPQTYVVVMTAYGTIDSAVEAMKNGAFDYITKPFKTEEILIVIKKALEDRALRKKIEYLTQQVEQRYKFDNIIGKSKAMQDVFEMIKRVSKTDTTVLITGKTGTGKELVAKAIHFNSKRKEKPFVVVNSSAIPETLLESELFGYIKGAFTGALRDKRGLFQEAHQGTLFLDEIGEIPPSVQVKLLRAIEDQNITPVGGTKGEKVDIRLVAATNHELQEEVNKGSFRSDLYYRLRVMSIRLPELKERREDIPMLAKHFLKKYNSSLRKEVRTISKETLNLLLDYDWPGNVRELEHAIERAVLVCDSEDILPEHLPPEIQFPEERRIRRAGEEGISLETVEKEYIKMILKKTGGHKSKAASILGMDRRTLYRKLKKYDID
ncbi:MAG: sigma-54 dependent transcriptional regulator [candidate division Zixibacteria bacterium]|nr:sigma-54 dependent transcriptional regulator [candidate division Zixibacteria bacterium]